MANEYNRFNHHHHHYHHQHHHHHAHLHITHRGTFLPMLCSRPSIKDVQVPSNAFFSNGSVSPKISCIGQVKRNNKVSGFPITSQTNNSSNNIKYSKLKKLFSGKNLTTATPTKTATAATATSCPSRSRRPQVSNVKQDHCAITTTINLVDLDPPLPVIKRVHKSPQEGEEDSLWKRRSGGAALKGLQLKQVHHPRHQTQSTSV
ncbi:hypothetical protein RchiOBHm_Chr7g0240831 [Rosa chinensis]|uniref:Uncharacterized protein n=1 Tax=Rosa chinensis TaxID=74649 RepID=A0A2P6PI29_ROSCH|nr:midnolin homolog [Rosa chinensis]PRQ21584.1 hypothetical protein RchiOBHm_Chr7g0240831 [Rosa chinensis]